jgi:hypothetical protein
MKGRRHFRDLSIDGRIILNLKKYGVAMWTGDIWLRIRANNVLL